MLRNLFGGGDITQTLLAILYSIPAILFSLSCHEWAHAFAAYKCGDPTARNLGRMTINPMAHLDPMGLIMLVLVGFGWAKPVPVSFRNSKNIMRDTIIVSLAGIVMNIFLLFVFTGIYVAIFMIPNFYNEMLINFIVPFLSINACLAIFNLLPIPPLDGFNFLETVLIKATGPKPFMFIRKYGTIILLVLLITGGASGIISGGASFLMDIAFKFYGLFLPIG